MWSENDALTDILHAEHKTCMWVFHTCTDTVSYQNRPFFCAVSAW